MKNFLRPFLALCLCIVCGCSLRLEAAGDHGHEHDHEGESVVTNFMDYIQGTWQVNSTGEENTIVHGDGHDHSDHDHGDHAHDKVIKLHAGHPHLPKSKRAKPITMSFCSFEGEVYGQINQRKVIDAPKKLKVSGSEELENGDHSLTLVSKKGDEYSAILSIAQDVLWISLDGTNYYGAVQKKSKVTKACRKQIKKIRKQKLAQ